MPSFFRPGQYTISLIPPNQVTVGVNPDVDVPRPVVALGGINVFNIERVGENLYTFTIFDETGRILYVRATEDERVDAYADGPATAWTITPQEGHYTIKLDSELGWTLEAFTPGEPVILDPVPEPPTEFQLWDINFVGLLRKQNVGRK